MVVFSGASSVLLKLLGVLCKISIFWPIYLLCASFFKDYCNKVCVSVRKSYQNSRRFTPFLGLFLPTQEFHMEQVILTLLSYHLNTWIQRNSPFCNQSLERKASLGTIKVSNMSLGTFFSIYQIILFKNSTLLSILINYCLASLL